MDGLTLGFVARELDTVLKGGRVDKITQPERDTVILLIRANNANYRLLLCASPQNARCHLTGQTFSNPLEPPVLCMLMRKQLLGARLLKVEQQRGDRIVYIDFDAMNDLGDHVQRRLVLEIMGRHSNLMLLDEKGRIQESTRHVGLEMSRVRQVQPGLYYEEPPAQDKLEMAVCTEEELLLRLNADPALPLHKFLMNNVTGFSSQAAREIAVRITSGAEENPFTLAETAARLHELFVKLPSLTAPAVYEEDGEVTDVFAFPYYSRDLKHQTKADTMSHALERYFGSRDQKDRLSQRSASMVRLLKSQLERCERKLALQEEELSQAAHMEDYRIFGELLHANLYQLKRGQSQVELENFYDPDGGTIIIALDNTLSPQQNAQKYFKKYQKARSAQKTAAEQKEKTLAEMDYLESMLLDTDKCVGESELEEIREELVRTGYMKRSSSRKEKRQLPKSKPYRYESSDGIEIHVGKNAAQNDRLTTGARPDEMWLHAKDMPGSHVIIRCEGEIPPATLLEAAKLACYYSKGQSGSSVPIDYTRRRYVKKPGGAAPGMVIYTHQHTLFMTVTEQEIKAIRLLEA